MKLDTTIFKKALGHLPKKIAQQFKPGTPDFLAWLQENRVPAPVIEHFAIYSVTGKSAVDVGFASFWPEHLICKFHDDTPEYSTAGWLICGSMPNGDFVILDIGGTGAIYNVSHEQIWDRAHHVRTDLHSITIRICDSIGQFLKGLLEDKYPYDYFEAKEIAG